MAIYVAYFLLIWCISLILVCSTKKNLATLITFVRLTAPCHRAVDSDMFGNKKD
jgi:hypothetical protein